MLSETTVANLYAINQIRNLYAHEIEIETQEFDATVRSIIKGLKWYGEGSLFYQKYNTTLLFSTLANNTYHELQNCITNLEHSQSPIQGLRTNDSPYVIDKSFAKVLKVG